MQDTIKMAVKNSNVKTITEYRDAQMAFEDAIRFGRLSTDKNAPNFAGRFMYMGTVNGRDLFKDICSRAYMK